MQTRELTVFLAPDQAGGGVLDVLADLSAAGLVDPFLWVRESQVASARVGATEVRGGRRRHVGLETVLADGRFVRIRLCEVVPLAGRGAAVGMAAEQQLSELVTLVASTIPVTRIRCIVARVGDQAPAERIERDGWHNVVLVPEDALGPTSNVLPLARTTDPVEIGRHAAPMIAGLVGLWTDITGSPLDTMPATPGIRAGRGFFRRVDARAVERELRRQVLSTQPRLPLPRSHQSEPALYIEDVPAACDEMAQKWWAKHKHLLVSELETRRIEDVEAMLWHEALRWLFEFIWGELLRFGPAWLRNQKHQMAVRNAERVHRLVFGTGDSAYTVVVNGRTKDGLAGWDERIDSAGKLDDSLVAAGENQRLPSVNQRAIWEAYVRGALTLADAGERDDDMAPVTSGQRPAVLSSVEDCVPTDSQFVVPGRLAAEIGDQDLERLAPGDALGAATLRLKLADMALHSMLAAEAGATIDDLDRWQAKHEHSYSARVGWILSNQIQRVIQETQENLRVLDGACKEAERPDTKRRHLLTRLMLTLAVLAMLVAPVLAVTGVTSVSTAILIGTVPITTWLVFAVARFATERQRIFQEITRRKNLVREVEAATTNLKRLPWDLRRLDEAYQHYLVWSRIVGVFLDAPFGPESAEPEQQAHIAFGLPRAARTTQAQVGERATAEAAAELRTARFRCGWLSAPWQTHVAEAGVRLGLHELPGDSKRLLDLNGAHLREWADLLVRDGTAATAGDEEWAAIMNMPREHWAHLEESLLAKVHGMGPDGGAPTTLPNFLEGIDRDVSENMRREFGSRIFTAAARAADRSRVASHWKRRVQAGLSLVVVNVQLSGACPAYELTIAECRGESVGPADDVELADDSVPPAPEGFGAMM